MKKLFKKYWALGIVLAAGLPGVVELFKPGFFPMHDDVQVSRVSQMAKALAEGQLPVRWVADLGYGYGYPIFNFYNPLAYYFGGLISLSGINALFSTKAMFAVGFLAAGVGMYLLAAKLFGKLAGLTAAVFYLYAPYHALQFYVRGSVAEMWAYGIIPFVFWGILKRNCYLAGMFLALLILSHNLTAVISIPFILLVMLVLFITEGEYKKWLPGFAVSLLIGFGFSAFFWLPAVLEKKFTMVDLMVSEKFNPLVHFVYPIQLWNSLWGYGGSAPGMPDGMSFQIGKIHILASIAALGLAVLLLLKKKKFYRSVFVILFLLIFSIFMTTSLSGLIWEKFYFAMQYLQFPWRFLVFTSLFSSLLAGGLIYLGKKMKFNFKIIISAALLLIAALFYFNFKYFKPQFLYPAQAEDFLTDEKIRWVDSKVSDEYLPLGIGIPANQETLFKQKYFLSQGGQIKEITRQANYYNLQLDSLQNNFLTINNAYFPGWKAWLDDNQVSIDESRQLINISIPSGRHTLVVKFTNTPVRTIADIISLATLCLMFFYLFKLKSRIWKIK